MPPSTMNSQPAKTIQSADNNKNALHIPVQCNSHDSYILFPVRALVKVSSRHLEGGKYN